MDNKQLVAKYPFLWPRSAWNGDKISKETYDYSFTVLDDLPTGWVKAFGEQMLEEIAVALRASEHLDDWYIVQLKEKFGSMRLYPNFSFPELDNCHL